MTSPIRAPVLPLGPARAAKRALETAAAAALLAVALPFLGLAALAIILDDRGPIFFRQARAGLGGRTFEVVKLRTMRVGVPKPEQLKQVHDDNPLVTRAGRWLRRLKVDELPQLWNVLTGDMALVGPRPAMVEIAARYGARERRRLAVRPGMTGWAQVNGNVALSWPERIVLDVWYVRHWSLGLDLVILARTVWVLLAGERPSASALSRAHAEW
jgi:lipopolysaccharide/colanic/teichoic acid biosynthesis glycosyltransferase